MLRAYLQQLLAENDVKRITSTVSPDLEIAALCRREFTSDRGGRALLFDAVSGTSVRIVANLFGTQERLLNMLNVNACELKNKVKTLIQSGTEDAAANISAQCNQWAQQAAEPDYPHQTLSLNDIPALRSWPGEKDRYLTLALAHTVDPETRISNLGLYRAALVGNARIAVNFAPGSGADRHLRSAEQQGKKLPIALILGSDPALYWAAAAPLPTGCSEYGFARAISGRELGFAQCMSQPLSVPATAEILIEGEIRPGERVREGPFGNHTGQYAIRDDCPLMRVTAIRHRLKPLMPVTVVGPAPSENIQLGHFNEMLLREMCCYDDPRISDLAMPELTMFHGAAVIAVRESAAAEIADVIRKLAGSSYLRRSRLLLLVDDDINIRQFGRSWWRAVNMLKPERLIHAEGRLFINATGVDRQQLVTEDLKTASLISKRHYKVAEQPQRLCD